MKRTIFPLALLLASLTACSTAASRRERALAEAKPETVLVTYHVKPGKEAEFQDALAQVWDIYLREDLVFAKPHVIVEDKETGDGTRIVEIFTWVSHAAPEHVPHTVKTIWNQELTLCEPRDGHRALEGGEVKLLVP